MFDTLHPSKDLALHEILRERHVLRSLFICYGPTEILGWRQEIDANKYPFLFHIEPIS